MENNLQSKEFLEVRETGIYGLGLFATQDIPEGEVVYDFSQGRIHEAEKTSTLPKEIADYAVQFDEHKWVDTAGIGRYLNHSCEPNCGIRDLFKVVAMRNIATGEQITFDYEMTEDSDWTIECKCGSASCRKIIGTYKNMPVETRKKYNGYISEWLKQKYLSI